jgi:hypothetical protein
MKKIVLSLAGVLAATAFAPEAAAIPSFARQTGMACTACHFQHFPVLNSFGRAFKAGGYTMSGAQGKVEGEHLSIPDTLNGSMLVKVRYQKANGTDAPNTPNGATTNTGQWQIPDEFSLFFGGRVGENTGFLSEINLGGVSPQTGGVAAQFKMPFVFDMGAAKLSVIPFLTDSGSMGYGYELSSTGIVRALRWSEERSAITAANYIGMNSGEATGLALVAQNEMGYVNVTRWSPHFSAGGGAGQAIQLRNNWLRLAATPTIADWAMHIGLGVASGSSEVATSLPTDPKLSTKATLIDFQGQTTLGANDLSVYASYGSASASSATETNQFNTGTNAAKKAMGFGADYSVIPHVLHVGGAYLSADTGAAANNKETKIMVQGIYDLTQNIALHMTYVKSSGSRYNGAANTSPTNLTLMLESSW